MQFEKTILPNGMIVATRQMQTNGLAYVVLGTKRGGEFFGPPELFHALEHALVPAYRQTVESHDVEARASASRVTIAEFWAPEKKIWRRLSHVITSFTNFSFSVMEKELGPIAVELNTDYDNPSVFVERLFRTACFPKSNIARPFTEEFASVRSMFDKRSTRFYWKKFFDVSNLILSVVSEHLTHEEICRWAENNFPASKSRVPRFRRPSLGYPSASMANPLVVERPAMRNIYFVVGKPLPRLSIKTQVALDIGITFFQGLINNKLRYRNGVVYDLSMDLMYDYLCGYWELCGECEPKNFQHVITTIERGLKHIVVSDRALHLCKAKLIEREEALIAGPETYTQALYHNIVDGIDAGAYVATVESISRSYIQRACAKWLSPRKAVLVILTSEPDIVKTP